MFEILFGIIFVVLLTAILMAVLSPLESLGWWAGWYSAPAEGEHGKSLDPLTRALPPGEHFVVFLTGIGSMKAEIHIPE